MECIRLAHETNTADRRVHQLPSSTRSASRSSPSRRPPSTTSCWTISCDYGMDKIEYALDTDDKNVREERLTAAVVDFKEKFGEKYERLRRADRRVPVQDAEEGRQEVAARGQARRRPRHGRDPSAGRRGRRAAARPRLRPVHPRPDAGALHLHAEHPLRLRRSSTPSTTRTPKRYIHHYNFPAYSTGEARRQPLHLPPRDRPRRAG